MCSRLGRGVERLCLSARVALASRLAYFASPVWGGLVPICFQQSAPGREPRPPAFMLTVAACLSVFFVGFWALRSPACGATAAAAAARRLSGSCSAVPGHDLPLPACERALGWCACWGEGGDIAGHTSGFILLGSVAGAICVCAGAMLPASRRWLLGAAGRSCAPRPPTPTRGSGTSNRACSSFAASSRALERTRRPGFEPVGLPRTAAAPTLEHRRPGSPFPRAGSGRALRVVAGGRVAERAGSEPIDPVIPWSAGRCTPARSRRRAVCRNLCDVPHGPATVKPGAVVPIGSAGKCPVSPRFRRSHPLRRSENPARHRDDS